MKYLFDTNIIIALTKNDKELFDKVCTCGMISISVITYGELILGANYSQRVQENIIKINKFISDCVIIKDINRNTANHYGEVKSLLKRIGKSIPDNDLWIVATAKELDYTIISRDNHILNLDFIKSEKW